MQYSCPLVQLLHQGHPHALNQVHYKHKEEEKLRLPPAHHPKKKIKWLNNKRLKVEDCNNDVVVTTFTNRIREWDLVKSLCIDPTKGFEKTMDWAKTHEFANKSLHSSGNAKHMKSTRQEKKSNKKCNRSDKRFDKPRPPSSSKRFAYFSWTRTKIILYFQGEDYLIHLLPSLKSPQREGWKGLYDSY